MNYEEMWNQLYSEISNKAKTPTYNAHTMIKQAEELARKQAMFDVLSMMDDIKKNHELHANSKKNDLYKL